VMLLVSLEACFEFLLFSLSLSTNYKFRIKATADLRC
jgi:hypothetical protein